MSKILEEIIIEENSCIANIYLEFLGKKFKLAEKVSKDAFKTIDVRFFNEIEEYCLDEDISGYTLYQLLSSVKEVVSDGNYNKLYSYIEKFNVLEEKSRQDIVELSKQRNKIGG